MRIALAIPHAPWVEGRPESLRRLIGDILPHYPESLPVDLGFRLFSERAPNWQWSLDMWRWFAEQDVDWCLQLQDDVIVSPQFWTKLTAMLDGCGACVRAIGLEAAHPAGPHLATQGHRWYRTRAWIVGVGWLLHRSLMPGLVEYRDAVGEAAKKYNEDDFIGRYLQHMGVDAWHPMPSIIDHDLEVPSSYMNDGHILRRPTVLWGDYPDVRMHDPDFWRTYQETPFLCSPYADTCWFCSVPLVKVKVVVSHRTSAKICGRCIANVVAMSVGVQ